MYWRLIWICVAAFIIPHQSFAQDAQKFDIAISVLKEICQHPQQYSIDARAGGVLSAINRLGQASASLEFTLQLNDIPGLAGKLTGDQILIGNDRIRQCMETNFLRVLTAFAPPPVGPTVLLMDSVVNAYRLALRATAGSNADDISAALTPVEVRTQKETTGCQWSRQNEVLQNSASLVVIHYLAFERPLHFDPQSVSCPDSKARLLEVVALMLNKNIPVVVYSRTPNFCSQQNRNALRQELIASPLPAAQVTGKVFLISMANLGLLNPDFQQQAGRTTLRAVVQRALGLNQNALPPAACGL